MMSVPIAFLLSLLARLGYCPIKPFLELHFSPSPAAMSLPPPLHNPGLQGAISNFFSTILGVPTDQATAWGQQVVILEFGIAQLTEWPLTLSSAIHVTDVSQLAVYNASLDLFLSAANITFGSNPLNVYVLSPPILEILASFSPRSIWKSCRRMPCGLCSIPSRTC